LDSKGLTWLRGTLEVHDEMDEMRAESEAMKLVPKTTLREMLSNPSLRSPLMIAVMMMLAQQLSGINAVIYFSTDIFTSAGLGTETAQYATLGMGGMNVLMTIISLILIERAGRKTLMLVGLIGMLIDVILLTICLYFKVKSTKFHYNFR
jgi:MFS transporter, SP family, solute carrier family 2 (facilitated glucose transporter), member 1